MGTRSYRMASGAAPGNAKIDANGGAAAGRNDGIAKSLPLLLSPSPPLLTATRQTLDLGTDLL